MRLTLASLLLAALSFGCRGGERDELLKLDVEALLPGLRAARRHIIRDQLNEEGGLIERSRLRIHLLSRHVREVARHGWVQRDDQTWGSASRRRIHSPMGAPSRRRVDRLRVDPQRLDRLGPVLVARIRGFRGNESRRRDAC